MSNLRQRVTGLMICCMCVLTSIAAQAKPLLADMAQGAIDLHAGFRGTEMLVFGARNQPGDIIITVRGPHEYITVREKQRIAGMWMFTRKAKYQSLPSFFATASTKRPNNNVNDATSDMLNRHLLASASAVIHRSALSDNRADAFDKALLRIKQSQRLYYAAPFPISFFGESLFKTRIPFPDTMPPGRYVIEVMLLDGSSLLAIQTLFIDAHKSGLEASLHALSQDHPVMYGVVCVLMGLLCGSAAHRLFRRK